MPVFSGCGVDTRINNLNTYLLDIAIDKKKYDPIRGEFTGAFENKLLIDLIIVKLNEETST